MWRAIFIVFLACFPISVWAYSAGIEARVLPNEEGDILAVSSFNIIELGSTEVVFEVKSNLPTELKLLYGTSLQKESVFSIGDLSQYHYFTLQNLRPATLYYYRLYLFNDKDSISLGDQVFKTAGQPRIDWFDQEKVDQSTEKKDFLKSVAGDSDFQESVGEEAEISPASRFFGIADLAFLLLCLSVFLLLLAILRHLRQVPKE